MGNRIAELSKNFNWLDAVASNFMDVKSRIQDVSNLTSSIRVPFTDIEKVWARNTGRSGWYIYISFKNKNRYGHKIYFLPYRSEMVLMDGVEHPVVIELKNEILKRTHSLAK